MKQFNPIHLILILIWTIMGVCALTSIAVDNQVGMEISAALMGLMILPTMIMGLFLI